MVATMTTTSLPPVVYAPTMPDGDQTRIRMHRMRDDSTALFVYSAIDRLEAQYGDGHPWVLMSQADLERAGSQVPFDMLFLDRPLYPEEGPRA